MSQYIKTALELIPTSSRPKETEWPCAYPDAIVQCPFKLEGRRVDGECRRNRRNTDINQRPAGTTTLRENGTE